MKHTCRYCGKEWLLSSWERFLERAGEVLGGPFTVSYHLCRECTKDRKSRLAERGAMEIRTVGHWSGGYRIYFGPTSRDYFTMSAEQYEDEKPWVQTGTIFRISREDDVAVYIDWLWAHPPRPKNVQLDERPKATLPRVESDARQPFDYHRYLASREWALLKRRVRERCRGVCERCGTAPYQETHHLTYERVGHELLEDLQGLCRRCHQFLSAVSDVDPLGS